MGDQVNQEAEASGCVVTDRTSNPRQQQTLVTQSPERNEQVRSRWTPKPEQILILESIFNSGMVNPPKDETIKIRRLLERFGPVGDANVFYWFQNRRSRSRRRQRQMQASYMEANARNNAQNTIQYDMSTNVVINPSNNMIINPTALGAGFVSAGTNSTNTSSSVTGGALPFLIPSSSLETASSFSHTTMGSGNGFDENGVEGFFNEMGFDQEVEENGSSQANALPFLCTHDVTSDLQYLQQPVGVGGGELGGFVTVFINGVPTEVARGPLDMKAMCGQDFLLVHSSGHPVSINEYGFSTHSLQHGESYFLVAKSV